MNEILLDRVSFWNAYEFGRLGCSAYNQPYVVPIYFAYKPGYIYVL
jgi:nitroimidazol reductase NimA-like FMN-containing flavoprotein (pyridoxamine 5'-phosphate oxidase superfamily)